MNRETHQNSKVEEGRSEQAILELNKKYGKIFHKISYNIVNSRRDAEDCVNDAYLGVWNTIPPTHPDPLPRMALRLILFIRDGNGF
ncbi:MAG: hypothetical protein LUD14_00020 [Clostridiales bacterium]|nr:hypothetical protein [Clostridiales bacterium]